MVMSTNIDAALFPVRLSDIYLTRPKPGQGNLFEDGEKSEVFEKVPRFKAVESVNNGYVFSVVAPDYKLVTNEEAIELGKACFRKIFNLVKMSEMQVFNVLMPKTKSYCHIDYIHSETNFSPFKNDQWFPYLRISNSYNRMFALNFDLGFCRWICKNGVIFGKRNIEFKYYHSKKATDPKVEFNLRAGELAALEARFIASLENLQRYHVPRNVMWALACKVFEQGIPAISTPKQREIEKEKRSRVLALTNKYFDELGENGYAALNVLTDFATRPVGYISLEGQIDALQRKAGGWIEEFIEAIQSRDFSFETYLGDYRQMVA